MTNKIDKQSFGEAGCQLVSGSPTSVPEGQYCAITFITDSQITTPFESQEVPLLEGTQTSITYPAGFTLFTPIKITTENSVGKINGAAVLYKAL